MKGLGVLWKLGIQHWCEDGEYWNEFNNLLAEAEKLIPDDPENQMALHASRVETVRGLAGYLAGNLTYGREPHKGAKDCAIMFDPEVRIYSFEEGVGIPTDDLQEDTLLLTGDDSTKQIAFCRLGLAINRRGKLILLRTADVQVVSPGNAIRLFGMDDIVKGFIRLMYWEQILNRRKRIMCGK